MILQKMLSSDPQCPPKGSAHPCPVHGAQVWTVHVSLDGQADTHISPHTQKHPSEALTLATMWMDPENMMFSERQTQKDTQDVISLMGNVQNRQVQRQSTSGEQVGVTADGPSSALPPVPPGDREALQAAMGQHHPAEVLPTGGAQAEQLRVQHPPDCTQRPPSMGGAEP